MKYKPRHRRRYQGKLVPAEEKFPSEDEKFLLDHQESHHNVLHLHSKLIFLQRWKCPIHSIVWYELGIHLFVSWVMFICGFSTKVTSNILIFKQLWGNYHNYTLWSQKNFPKMNKPKFWKRKIGLIYKRIQIHIQTTCFYPTRCLVYVMYDRLHSTTTTNSGTGLLTNCVAEEMYIQTNNIG